MIPYKTCQIYPITNSASNSQQISVQLARNVRLCRKICLTFSHRLSIFYPLPKTECKPNTTPFCQLVHLLARHWFCNLVMLFVRCPIRSAVLREWRTITGKCFNKRPWYLILSNSVEFKPGSVWKQNKTAKNIFWK